MSSKKTDTSSAQVEFVREKNKVVVERTFSEEVIGIHKFITEPARVGTKVGVTVNLGNFDSVRIDVWCEVPCYKEEIDEAQDFVQAWCEQRVETEKKRVVEYRDKKTKSFNPL